MQSVPDNVSGFVYSGWGRIARVVFGSMLIGSGLGRGGFRGITMSLVGLEMSLAGLFDFSLLGTIAGRRGGEIYTPTSPEMEPQAEPMSPAR